MTAAAGSIAAAGRTVYARRCRGDDTYRARGSALGGSNSRSSSSRSTTQTSTEKKNIMCIEKKTSRISKITDSKNTVLRTFIWPGK